MSFLANFWFWRLWCQNSADTKSRSLSHCWCCSSTAVFNYLSMLMMVEFQV